ncbi:hypothetical protein AAFF_G00102050 [Aldrovandia affinis]|uniref:Translation initiation factor IF-3, mitochondrial n=1 Tax=Aldrovandia affinis TaxID=143900 RepID=A0AAD7WC88_9TELE|nr:hypothetical protein AAFF_G00102050 [Aldrovandia affinis]
MRKLAISNVNALSGSASFFRVNFQLSVLPAADNAFCLLNMSVACLRTLSQTARGMCHFCLSPWKPTPRFLSHRGAPHSVGWVAALSTMVDGENERQAPRKKQQDARARSSIGSVGRKIHQRHLQVIGHDGANLGSMHRADVLRLMDQQGFKLVPLNENKDPPVYQLMTGKQIHDEQLKLREKQKAKPGPVQVKELTLSLDIASHDQDTKLQQIQSWLSKKHHVRVTLRKGRVNNTQPLDSVLEKIIQSMPVTVGLVSKPKMNQDGRMAICILRAPSKKELRQNEALRNEPIQPLPSTESSAPDGNPSPSPDSSNGSPLQQ